MDPFRLCIALAPLAAYCLLLGILNLSRRARVVPGGRDVAALGLAVAGLMIVGPLELFMPEAAVTRFGGYVWVLMLSLYGLGVTLWALSARPRLVVLNTTIDELRPVLAELAARLDPDARWAGESLALPNFGIQLHLDSFAAMRNVTLTAVGDRQDLAGWRTLQRELAAALRDRPAPANPRGVSLISVGLLLAATCIIHVLSNTPALAQGMREMLRL